MTTDDDAPLSSIKVPKKSLITEPVVDPFQPATFNCLETIRFILVGLVLFLPRLILTVLLLLFMYVVALFACTCCDDERTATGFPKYPARRPIITFLLRGLTRVILFVWGFYFLTTDEAPNAPKTPEGEAEPVLLCLDPHISLLDPFIIFAKHGGTFVAASSTINQPIIGRITQAMQFIAVDRANPNSRHEVADEIKRRARWSADQPKEILDKYGNWGPIAMFPSATCTNGQAVLSFKIGCFLPMRRVRCLSVTFPASCCCADPPQKSPSPKGWVAHITFKGIMCRTLSSLINYCHVRFVGDIAPGNDNDDDNAHQPTPVADDMTRSATDGEGMLCRSSSLVLAESEKSEEQLFSDKVRKIFAKTNDMPMTEHTYDDVRLDDAAMALFGDDFRLTSDLELKKAKVDFKKAKDILQEFAEINTRKDGQLSRDDFIKLLKLEDQPSIADAVFSRFDTSGDGLISFREYLQFSALTRIEQIRTRVAIAASSGGSDSGEMVQANSMESLEDAYVSLFSSVFDLDGNGVCDREEFRKGMERVVPGISEQRATALFNELDANADGGIVLEEFLKFSRERPQFMNFVVNLISTHNENL